MEPIIKSLNSDLLTKFGFTFDGYYWKNPMVHFSLVTSDKEGTYLVVIPNTLVGVQPPSVSTNTQLLQLFVKALPTFLEFSIKQMQLNPDQIQPWMFQSLINKFFRFDESLNIKFAINLSNGGLGILPANEVTLTILSGVMCEFDVSFVNPKTDEITHEKVFVEPTCMSTNYLRKLFGTEKLIYSVKVVLNEDGDLEPFFGCGFSAPEIPSNPTMS